VQGDSRSLVFSMYGILGGLMLAFFCRYMNFIQKYKSVNPQQDICTTTIFPVFKYDSERALMVQADDIPLYFFIVMFIIIFWSMLVCVLSVQFYLIGMFLLFLAFGVSTIYSVEVFFLLI